ncbi:MAG TPA: hypothetical protein VGK48_01515 [Terriglobia bacterium]|jgi:hypothetical protein
MRNKSKVLSFVSCGVLTALFFFVVNVHSAEAQATFGVAGSTSVLNSLGYTELLGPVTFFVQSGTTQSGTIEFFIPNIAFTDISGVALVGTGGLAAATLSAVIPSAGDVIIGIPAGAGAGSTVTLSGLRISAVGAAFTTLNAAISASGNLIVAGQNSVPVVRGIASGVSITNNGGSTLLIANNTIVSTPGTYVVGETFLGAFSSTVGVLGQTNKTQIVFQVTGLPDGISLTFPSPIGSDSGTGANVIIGGGPLTITNQSTSNQVIYEYNAAAPSQAILDQFSIMPMVGITGTVGSGSALVQASLGPIGAAVPNTQFPSTAIPRYMASFTPPAPTVPTAPVIVSNLFFPVPSAVNADVLTIANTDSGTAAITAVARAEDGTLANIASNQVTLNLTGQQTNSLALTDIFGSGASAAGIAAVELTSSNHLVANSIATIGSTQFGIASPLDSSKTFLPFDSRTSADVPMLTMENPTGSDVSAQVVLLSLLGAQLATANPTVKSHGALRQSFTSLFPGTSLPLSGTISIVASGAVRTVLLNNPNSQPEETTSLAPVASATTFPYFVFGAGYDTVVTMVNSTSSATPASVSLTAYTLAGSALSSKPVILTLAPGQRQDFEFNALFGTSSSAGSVTEGYFTVSSQSTTNTLFGVAPAVYGLVRFLTGALATGVPLVANPGTQFYMTPTGETTNTYTGIAVVNATAAAVTVTLTLTSTTGTALGTTSFTLAANNGTVQLLRQFIPLSLPHDNGNLQISATGAVGVLGFRGTLNSSQLIFLRGESAPK